MQNGGYASPVNLEIMWSFLSYQMSTTNKCICIVNKGRESLEVKRGSLFILSRYFIWVSPTLCRTLGGIIRGRRKKAMLRLLDKKWFKLFCISSLTRFFHTETCIACLYFFQQCVIEYICKISVSCITFLRGSFSFILFQHICVISETGKQKYKAWKQSSSALTTELWNVLFTESYLSQASTLVHQLNL